MEKYDDKRNEYRTKDLGEVATLICKEARLMRMERVNDVCWFVFRDIDFCWDISNKYYFGDISVHPRVFQGIISMLKTKIFAEK